MTIKVEMGQILVHWIKIINFQLITSAEEVMFFRVFICLSVFTWPKAEVIKFCERSGSYTQFSNNLGLKKVVFGCSYNMGILGCFGRVQSSRVLLLLGQCNCYVIHVFSLYYLLFLQTCVGVAADAMFPSSRDECITENAEAAASSG